jgi:hypothetical protein
MPQFFLLKKTGLVSCPGMKPNRAEGHGCSFNSNKCRHCGNKDGLKGIPIFGGLFFNADQVEIPQDGIEAGHHQ